MQDMTFDAFSGSGQSTPAREETFRSVFFEVGGQVFAFGVEMVREILLWQGARKVPHTHKALMGVATVRGEVIPVIDLGVFLGVGSTLPGEQKKLVVLEIEGGIKAAFAVDEVRRIFDTELSRVDRTLKGVVLGDYLDCVIKHPDGDILMPDPVKIMEALRLETARLSRYAAGEPIAEDETGKESGPADVKAKKQEIVFHDGPSPFRSGGHKEAEKPDKSDKFDKSDKPRRSRKAGSGKKAPASGSGGGKKKPGE